MNLDLETPVQLLAGVPLSSISPSPLQPYAPDVLGFLSDLSRVLLQCPELRQYPDVAAFAYWCRASNTARLSRALDSARQRVGRGLALHIAPANVPVNFAFSWAFGMLAGNANIVRIPNVSYPQIEMICTAVNDLFSLLQHQRVAGMNSLIRYPRSDSITAALSAAANARILWGGDQTIAHLRAIPSSARCIDVAFADRYSICVMDADAVVNASGVALQSLALGFYNDTYLMDQNACSSPHLVVWQGSADRAEQAMQRFWPALDRVLQDKYQIQPIQAIDKFVHFCSTAIIGPTSTGFSRRGNRVYRVRLAQLDPGIETYRGECGYFYEYVAPDIECLAGVITEKYQTITCFGIDRKQLARFVVERALLGVDRIVPVGRALEIGVIWDGFDLIQTLSRIVDAV